MFPDGGTPQVITVGGPLAYPPRRRAIVEYTESWRAPGPGEPLMPYRTVTMDLPFANDLMAAMAQQGVVTEWIEDVALQQALESLAVRCGVEHTHGTLAIIQAALARLEMPST